MNNNLQPIRREVDADNSCLFNSIAYLMERSAFNSESALKYRQKIVNYLRDDKFEKTLLDQPKDKYIKYIINPINWGGALEVKMFSEMFEKEIVCIDVKTSRCDTYGEDKNYDKRIFLLYNGEHYDPLVMNYDISADPLTDITIFDANDDNTFALIQSLVLEYKNIGDFVEYNSLKCDSCSEKFKTENDAVEHSLNFDHWNFSQI